MITKNSRIYFFFAAVVLTPIVIKHLFIWFSVIKRVVKEYYISTVLTVDGSYTFLETAVTPEGKRFFSKKYCIPGLHLVSS